MQRRLFEDLVVSAPAAPMLGRRAALLPLSVAAHAAALTLALLAPALTPPDMPELAGTGPIIDWAPRVMSHPAPPAPTPPPRAVPRQGSRPITTVSDPAVLPAPAAGPPVLVDEPAGLPLDIAPAPCLFNCDGAGTGSGNGVREDPAGGGDPNGTGTAPIRTGGIVEAPVRTAYVAPVYPDLARIAGVRGVVVLDCTIDPSGRVVDIRVLGGHPLLTEAAVSAVRQWRYTPTRLNGVPVPVLLTVTVRFVGPR
jgi:periplasmic protein TonB